MAIPDSPGANTPGVQVAAPLTVSGLVGTVYDVNVSIDGTACSTTAGSTTVGLNHTFVNDLVIALQSPDGTVVTVINRTDGGDNNFCRQSLTTRARVLRFSPWHLRMPRLPAALRPMLR